MGYNTILGIQFDLGDAIKGYNTILGIQFDLGYMILRDTKIVSLRSVKGYDPSYPLDFLMSGPVNILWTWLSEKMNFLNNFRHNFSPKFLKGKIRSTPEFRPEIPWIFAWIPVPAGNGNTLKIVSPKSNRIPQIVSYPSNRIPQSYPSNRIVSRDTIEGYDWGIRYDFEGYDTIWGIRFEGYDKIVSLNLC